MSQARGGWSPEGPIEYPPVFVWPPRPRAATRWFVGYPGYLWPFNAFYLLVALGVWLWATPSVSTMATWGAGWVAFVFVRNAVLMAAWYGIFHVNLYVRRSQQERSKYNAKWPAAHSDRCTLGSQSRENIFWSMASGLPIWTAWEVVTLWLFASGHIRWIRFGDHPVWFVALTLSIPVFRDLHFYLVHRLIHWPPLYKAIHSLHHRNTNPGPWSGLSMHPIEHVLYFSAIAIHWVVPSSPVHAMFTSFHLMMSPAPGHAGFEHIEAGPIPIDTGGYSHYLHHKYFEVNYADGVLPLDKWFGTFHDGSAGADAAMRRRRLRRSGRVPATTD